VDEIAAEPDCSRARTTEVRALEQLHGEKPILTIGVELVQRNQVRVAQIRQRPKLTLEAIERVGIALMQDFERHVLVASAIERTVDGAKAPGAEAMQHLKALRSENSLCNSLCIAPL